jgi:acetolactate synthase I/II/III large subunit
LEFIMNVAQVIAKRLKAFDTEYFFLLTGGDQPLWIALRDAGIRMAVARSEFSSVYMADGYARASGKPGLTYGQAGPGAANVAAALADPFWAQSPVVALTGATSTSSSYVGEYQALEQMPMFGPVTKWNAYASNPARVPDLVSLALRQALVPSRGPTHLDVPKDFFGLEIPNTQGGEGAFQKLPPVVPNPEAIERACRTLLAAKRPVILGGDGAVQAGAGEAIVALAEALQIPVATTLGGKTAVASAHTLNLGVTGRYSARVANKIVGESDCVLVVGSRLGGLATRGYTVPDQSAQIIMVDNDPSSFDTSYPVAVPVLADANLALEAIFAETNDHTPGNDVRQWCDTACSELAEWREECSRAMETAGGGNFMSPLQVIKTLSGYNTEITVVADTGYAAAWTGVLYPTAKPGSYFRAIGSLGWAFPASLGVQLARPEKVVCVTGDGGFGYHLADIETAVRMKIPVVVIVFNNSGLMFEYHEQKYRHNGKVVPEANNFSDVDYGAAARALGADGIQVNNAGDFDSAFRNALSADGPTVIDVIVDREAFPPVTNFEDVVERKL